MLICNFLQKANFHFCFISWDEWVGIDRLMKNTEENRQKLQDPKKREEMENDAKTGKKQKIPSG